MSVKDIALQSSVVFEHD